MGNRDASLLTLLGAAHSLNHSFFFILPPLLSIVIRDFNSTFEQLGLIATLSLLLYGLGAMVGGPLSDKIGSIRTIQIGSLLSGVSTFIILASENLFVFGVGMLSIAFGASFYHPTANRLIARVYQDRMAQVMGIHGAIGSLGYMFTPAIAFVLGISFGWRVAFVFFGLLSIVVGTLLGKIRVSEGSKFMQKKIIFEMFKDRGMLLIFLYFFLVGLYTQGVIFFFPTFLSLERSIAQDTAAYANSALLVMGVAGQLICGRISDRYGSKNIVVITNLGICFGLLALLWTPVTTMAVILFIIIYGTSVYGNQPPITSLVGKVSPKASAGLAFGVSFSLGFGLGSVSTTIAGYIADNYSLTHSYYAMSVVVLAALIVSLFLPSKNNK